MRRIETQPWRMLEFVVELVVELLGELLWQVGFEVLAEFGLESVGKLTRARKPLHPAIVGVGLLALGGLIGYASGWVLPRRLVGTAAVPGLSLVLAPLAAGGVMHFFGAWRRKRGGNPTRLATFWGGASLAFGLALARWLMVGRH